MKEQIEKEQKKLEALWEESATIDNLILKQRELLQTLHKKYNDSRTLTLKEIIQYNFLASTYEYFKKWCEEHGFGRGGYWDDTGEYTIQVSFCVEDMKKLKKQKQNISTYANIAKPKSDGYVWMSVIENSLSFNGSYHICYDKDKGYKIHHTYRGIVTDFMTKDELFEWGVKHIPYGGDRE